MIRAMLGAAALCCASLLASAALAAPPPDQVDVSILANAKVSLDALDPNFKGFGPQVGNVDTLINFTGSFHTRGLDGNGILTRDWPWAMVGNSPAAGGTTRIDNSIIPVSIRLLDANGNQRYLNGHRLFLDGRRNVRPLLNSPLYANSTYSSSTEPTQFTDGVFRAEFWSRMAQDWHTLLVPHVKEERVMSVPYGFYRFAVNADGSCCKFILIDDATFSGLLFPPTFPVDASTPIGAAELAGDMTTKTIATLLFGDVYLYIGTPSVCCVLGYHSFDYEPGVAANGNVQRAYVMNYTSWTTPGLFGTAFVDVTAASHEMNELFNDPLVGAFSTGGSFACGAPGQPLCVDTTPWWLAPNGNCQNNLETGDVIEGLPDATIAITTHGYTYHPQNEALLQWFEFREDSDAIGGAYSYPDPSVLPRRPIPQQVACTGPLNLDD